MNACQFRQDPWGGVRRKQETRTTVIITEHAYTYRLRLKCDGTRAETRFRLSAKSIYIGGGRQFSRLLAAEVCASVVVMLDAPCSEVV